MLAKLKPKQSPFKVQGLIGAGLRGRLVVVVHPTGTKAMFFRSRAGGRDELIGLGRYDRRGPPHGLTLAAAAEKARELSTRLRQTPDLKTALELERKADERQRERAIADVRAAEAQTLERLLTVYVAALDRRGKPSARDARNIFDLHVLKAFPAIAAKLARDVQPIEVAQMVRRLNDAGKDRTAGKLRSYLSAAFALAARAETDPKAPADALAFGVIINPAAAVRPYSGVKALHRVLTDAELRGYVEALDGLTEVTRDALRLHLLLAGQRPAQLLRASVDDVADNLLTLRDGKGKRAEPRLHVLPLSDACAAIVQRRQWAAGAIGTQYLFASSARRPTAPQTLSDAVTAISSALVAAGVAKTPFQLRDLRRTAETRLQALGISRDLRAQLLSHGQGGIQAAHYERHAFIEEKRAALKSWEALLDQIRTGLPAPANVVTLKRA